MTPDSQLSLIKELVIRKEVGFRPEFLLLRPAKPVGEFWMRLERTGPVSALSNPKSSEWEANDVVAQTVSRKRGSFSDPAIAKGLCCALDALREESKVYLILRVSGPQKEAGVMERIIEDVIMIKLCASMC
ncbi:uncharacterized protein EI90DRAFT_3290586 [Cantharellus anzutake]|uniref:uncharacterized protein n=1 Tax=Cantharellus anzutake TaxID=1750568 RepID=UPI001903280B|nr:uncharacterized protein EI90DRAFT_3290586 [Cantharellus anzutake]KAF8328417.1 hypothetical protein EI90DRAFT_3290586 [Cantharellus anzutake]